MADPNSSWEDRCCESTRSTCLLMGYMTNDLHLRLGLEQFNLAHLMPNKPDHKLVHCRPLNARKPIFRMDFGLDDSFNAVAGRIADKLHVSRDMIKLSAHNCSYNRHDHVDLKQGYQFKRLRDALVNRHEQTICDVLYYYVETPPKESKTDEQVAYYVETPPKKCKTDHHVVAYEGYPNAKQEHANDETFAEIRAFRRQKCVEMRNFPRLLNMLEISKRRGKGSPKKGQGRQANIRKMTWEKSFKRIVRNMQSSNSSYWRPATKQLCRLLSGEGPWIEEVLEKRLVHILLYFLILEKKPNLQVEAAKALKYLASGGTSEVVATQTGVQAMNSTYDALWGLLHSENYMVLSHACCSLAVLSGCRGVDFAGLLPRGLFFRIYELTKHPNLGPAALRVLGNFMLRDGHLITTHLNLYGSNVFIDLKMFLLSDNLDVRREACWLISYIAERMLVSDVQDGFFTYLIEPLVAALNKDEFVVVEAAVSAISNATFCATSEQMKAMVKAGCIEIMCELLCSKDIEIFEACLEGLENILKIGEEGKGSGVNPYVEHMKRIKGWTVVESACCLYEKEMLYKRSLELMVKYGALSPSVYEFAISDDMGWFAAKSDEVQLKLKSLA